ncbi:MAG TPA: FAD-dependent oxidoreductase, partial [Rhodoblastus sp.]|nr:FAD-dependent oxidoreductase [Rhodoblastus sp.]
MQDEAGVAEIYDYSRIGPDPLRRLIVNELGLDTKTLSGGPCVLGGKIVLKPEDLAQHFGQEAADEAIAFRKKCTEMLTPRGYYLSIAETDNEHPWRDITGAELLNTEIRSDAARRYVRAMAHSDVAAPPYHTDGLTFLKNAVMDLDGYMDIFSVVGGNEQIVDKLEEELDAQVRMNAHVRAVQPLADGTYRVEVDAEGFLENHIADFVVVALPLSAMACVNWRSDRLQRVIDDHIAYFDRPGHYLRATLAFKRPFWRDHLPADWWMSDAFDGCCIYDESARNNLERYGMLAFLIAGNAALSLANESDERIEQMCLDALPASLGDARDHFIEGRIHRWMASVNAIPGGKRVRRRIENHRPDPEHLPGVLIVGDYLFDSTLNGVMDSADAASDIIVGETLKRRRDQRSATPAALPDA